MLILLTYANGSGIKWQACNPDVVDIRKNYIKENYGFEPESEKPVNDVFIDFGGMMIVNEPKIKIEIDENTSIICFDRQLMQLHSALKKALRDGPRDVDEGFYRFGSWPFGNIMLSRQNVETAIKNINKILDKEPENKDNVPID